MNIDIIYILTVIAVVLVSMTLHETMHAFTSYWLGDDTAKLNGRLTFNPIKHIDPFLTVLLPIMLAIVGAPIFGGAKPVPFNRDNLRWGDWGVAIVALSGPLTNLFISFIIFGLFVLSGVSAQGALGQIFITTVYVNLGLFIFNMIPIPPLDGSRLLYALAPDFFRNILESIEKFGLILVFAILLLSGSALETLISKSVSFFIGIFGHIFGF
ncbi:MAG: site-2 protease family protein [Candidatus Saccharibacteria bacterium]